MQLGIKNYQLSRPAPSCSSPKLWKCPLETSMKVNWDGALKVNNNVTGLGGIVTDHTGCVVVLLWSSLSSSLKPIVVEATMLRKVMMLCKGMGFNHLNFEGDCLTIAQTACRTEEDCKDIEPLIFDIHLLLC